MGVSLYAFAVDTQLYLHRRPTAAGDAIIKLERCIETIRGWMAAHRLKFYGDKTEFAWLGQGFTQAFESGRCWTIAGGSKVWGRSLQRGPEAVSLVRLGTKALKIFKNFTKVNVHSGAF